MKVRRSIALAAALTSGLLSLTAASSAEARPCGAATELRTYTVTAELPKKTYKMGETVPVSITVMMPGPKDPVTEQPFTSPTYVPAEGVETGATFYTSDNDLPVFGRGITDQNGESLVKVKLTRGQPVRKIYASISAQKWTNRGGCPDIVQTGYQDYPEFFTLKK
jgi:hypothetical protein